MEKVSFLVIYFILSYMFSANSPVIILSEVSVTYFGYAAPYEDLPGRFCPKETANLSPAVAFSGSSLCYVCTVEAWLKCFPFYSQEVL